MNKLDIAIPVIKMRKFSDRLSGQLIKGIASQRAQTLIDFNKSSVKPDERNCYRRQVKRNAVKLIRIRLGIQLRSVVYRPGLVKPIHLLTPNNYRYV